MVVAQETVDWQESLTHTHAKRNPQPVRKGKGYSKIKSIMALAVIVGLTGAIGAETIHLTVVQGAQIRALETEIAAIQTRNDLLQMEADKLRSVGRIESVALSMGMEKPTGKVYMAGVVPAAKNQEGAPLTQAVTQTAEAQPSALKQFSQKFTSFFASTQR
ncbi:septum formation initiator [Desulfosporosinus sp.]|uniref:septum formation initiator n=1 Tax=Desulfosporosinus sp. TaxID=157907 RepID=UPI000E97051A|nr:septum formation initiator [Desulfosporosinus sp.]MBC2721391.1 septum formation initiator [Desulfosporosinus sp.]MBC2728090.1 septum formation initiator [Desulfosporosinus sp.]HBV85951.1 septum formation initiator [Desulfosporosinus sp.]